MKSLRAILLTGAIICLGVSAGAQNGPRSFTFDVQGAVGTYPWAINLEGWVTGWYVDSNSIYHGFLRDPRGTITTFSVVGAGTTSPGAGTYPYGINIAGVITGTYLTDGYDAYGFIRLPNGKFITFSAPKADPLIGCTCPQTINDRGDVAGNVVDSATAVHGFLRTVEGNITTFDVPAGGGVPAPGTGPYQGTWVNYSNALNNAGYIASYYIDASSYDRAYLRAPDGTFTVFAAPLSAPNEYMGQGSNTQGTVGQSINDQGTILGITIDKFGVWHGFRRSPEGKYAIFNAPNASTTPGGGTPNGWGTVPESINDFGEISGYFTDNNDVYHAFLVSPTGKITVYDAPGAGTNGAQLQGTYNFNINLLGMITGYYFDTNGVAHGYVRTP